MKVVSLEFIVSSFLVFLLVTLCFTGVYVPDVFVEKLNTNLFILLLSLISFLTIWMSNKRRVLLELLTHNRYIILYLSILLFLLIISGFRFFFYGVGDQYFVELQFKQLVISFISTICYSLVLFLVLSQVTLISIYSGVVLFMLVALLVIFFQLSFPDIKLAIINFTALDQHWKDFAFATSRGIGFQGLSIWDTSISYALLYLVFVSFWNDNNRLKTVVFYCVFSLILLLTILSGRTGFLLLFYMHISFGVYYKKKLELLALMFVIVFVTSFVYLFSSSGEVKYIIEFSFELFINLFSASVSTGSTDDLINNHLFFPDLDNLLLGDNVYIGDGDLNVTVKGDDSDSAFVIYYKAFGLIGLGSTLLMVIFSAFHISYILSMLIKAKFRSILLICSFFLFSLFIKVPLHTSAAILKLASFLLVFTYCCHSGTGKVYNTSSNDKVRE